MKHSISFAELCPADSHEFAEHLLFAVNTIASRAAFDALTAGNTGAPVFCHCCPDGVEFSSAPLEAAPLARPLFMATACDVRLDEVLISDLYKLFLRDLRDALIESELQQVLPLPPAACDEQRWIHLRQRVDNLQLICTLTPWVRLTYRVVLWPPTDSSGRRFTTDEWEEATEGDIWVDEPFDRITGRACDDDLTRLLTAAAIDLSTATPRDLSRDRSQLMFPLVH